MRTKLFASPGPTRRRSRLGLRLVVLVTGALTLGFLTAPPAAAAPGELTARNGAFYEYNDATVRVALARRVNHGLSVGYRTVSRTAVDGVDFIGRTGRLFFPAGTKVKTVRINILDDNVDEANEVFRLRLFDARRAVILDPVARVTIVDDDVAQTLSVRDASAQEGNTLVFPVVLSQVAEQTVSFRYATVIGTAGAGDFTSTSGFGSIPAGAYQTTISVPTTQDALFETGETFRVVLSDLSGAASGDLDATGTILNDDPGPTLRINDVSVSEGNSTTMLVTLSQATGSATSVQWRTTDGTAKVNQDYVRDSGTLTIPVGATSGLITVRTYEDTTLEPSEVFYVDLSSPVGATIADSRGVVTILDDDGPPDMSIGNATATEGGTASFTVTLSKTSTLPVTFNFGTVDGTAAAGSDYTSTSNSRTIPAGSISTTITVATIDDALDEEDSETFRVLLWGAVNATVIDGDGLGTVNDNDPLPTLSIGDPAAAVAEGANAVFPVTLSAASSRSVTVHWTATPGDGGNTNDDAEASDYAPASGALTIPVGSTTGSITIGAVNDTEDEDAEKFTVNLSSPTNATIAGGGAGAGTGTILASDQP